MELPEDLRLNFSIYAFMHKIQVQPWGKTSISYDRKKKKKTQE
jgi:hypothetical protein